jgi:serine/threonine protein kinase/tetratricopeptide (TPR) repeat protein
MNLQLSRLDTSIRLSRSQSHEFSANGTKTWTTVCALVFKSYVRILMDLREQLQTTLGSAYAVERELPGGGMSRVFVAHDTTLDRRVVVKTLSPDLAGGVSAERFRREIRLAASLQQANIVPVHSVGEMAGLPYYMMPFVEGESLRARLDAQGRLSTHEAIGILRDVARALVFAHSHGVVHRDIKPENILLSGSTAVVTDFGIAKAIEQARTRDDATALTQLGSALGSPAYMSPEQACGDADVDHRADIYSFGVVAYELLSGAPPFTQRSARALLAAHITEQPRALGGGAGDSAPELVALVMRCLAKEPAARPRDAREILDTLETATRSPSAGPSRLTRAKPSIAVLPFANLSPEPTDEYFADGLTDEVIADLSPIRGLHVIARASMMRYKGTTKDPVAIARELNVRYVLDGSVRRAGTSLRLTARLIDADDGSAIWSGKLGGSVEDVFAMQEQLSRTIVDSLRVTMSPDEARRLEERPIVDLRAYECYLQARQAMWTFTVPTLDRAQQLLHNAIDIIGDNPRLLAALGGVHLMYVDTGEQSHEEHFGAADDCVRRLALLDGDSAGRHWLEGTLHFRRGEIREAIASMERAAELEPNGADIFGMLWYAYSLAGRDGDARQAAEKTVALDPLTPLFQCLPGACEVFLGNYAAAVPYYRKFVAMDPANPAAYCFLVWALTRAGERDEAIALGERLVQTFPGTIFAQLGAVYVHALKNESLAGVQAITPQLRGATKQGELFGRILADALTLLGDLDGAVDALTDAVRFGLAHYPYLAQQSPLLAPLREHPRFQELLELVRGRWERGGASAEDFATTPSRE